MPNPTTMLLSDITLTITNPHQILNMGGPWVGDISIQNKLISKDCLIDNVLFKEDMNQLFFVNLKMYQSINAISA